MTKKLISLIFLFFIFYQFDTNSRPISYPGGWTFMQNNDYKRHSVHIHYTPSIKYSFGYRGEYWKMKEWQFHGAQLNYLLNRSNKPKSQSNLYIKSGIGAFYSSYKDHQNKGEPGCFSGLSFDWEDRRYFTSYENRVNLSKTIDRSFIQKARIGIAPYIGDYGDLHSWLMLQVEHTPQAYNKVIYTPMIRMFKGDFLAEAGISNHGQYLLNLILRF